MRFTETNYERYDQAIKRVVVLLGLVDKASDSAPFFENARQWMEGVPWTIEESNLAFHRLANAQAFSVNQQPQSARSELLALLNVLAALKNREPWTPYASAKEPPVCRGGSRVDRDTRTKRIAL